MNCRFCGEKERWELFSKKSKHQGMQLVRGCLVGDVA